ncbi:MAG: carboxypeptidase regulatory-like domain-containing protein [Planctomycetes bacterium]|nr:carboxypeptidase regulatory-like domain-containing protein [Planctomycetota bacterium]
MGLSVEGILVDPRGGRIGGAKVLAGGIETRTDSAGRFRLEPLDPGPHGITFAPGAGQSWGVIFFAERIVEGVEAGRDDLVVRVEDGRAVRGRILDGSGLPLARAEVVLVPAADERAMPEARSDPDGFYRLVGLPEGPLRLAAFHEGHLPALFDVKGEEAPVQRLRAGESIAGRLLDAEGQPAGMRSLHLTLRSASRMDDILPWRFKGEEYGPWFECTTAPDGSFRFSGLPAGEYKLEQRAGKDLVPIDVTTGTHDLRLRLLTLHTISGTVYDEKGAPVFRSGGRRLKISAYHASGQIGYIFLREDGGFRFDKVPEGRIVLGVIGWDDFKTAKLEVLAGAQDVRIQLESSPYRLPEPLEEER